jgi:hypothetical protein
MRISGKNFNQKNVIIQIFLVACIEKRNVFWDISTKPKIGILKKLLCLEASTKPHVYKKIHEFLINMAFTMACPSSKKGLKMVSGPLGVKL